MSSEGNNRGHVSTMSSSSYQSGSSGSSSSTTTVTSKYIDRDDIVSLIINDHRKVQDLFKQYEMSAVTDHQLKQRLVWEMIKELSVHAACEEMVLYPAMREKLRDGPRLVDHAIGEHHAAKETLDVLDSMDSTDPNFDNRVKNLIRDMEHHIQEEEESLLPGFRTACSPDELTKLGKEFISKKSIAPTRPHPSVPGDKDTLLNVLSVMSKPIDAIRDAVRFSGNDGRPLAHVVHDDSAPQKPGDMIPKVSPNEQTQNVTTTTIRTTKRTDMPSDRSNNSDRTSTSSSTHETM